MTIGFLDENQYRSYPLQPLVDRRLRPVLTDLSAVVGRGFDFSLAASELVLWQIQRDGVDWLFDIRIRTLDQLTAFQVVRVSDSAPTFSTHHATTDDGSYVYLTIGRIADAFDYVAPSVGEAPAFEDRCAVVPSFRGVESLTLVNGEPNRSALDTFVYVSPSNPGTNWLASMGDYEYDPMAYKEQVAEVQPPTIPVADGNSTVVRASGNGLVFSLRPGGGQGHRCCFVLPDRQTGRGLFRSFMGVLPDSRGNLELKVGQGLTLETVPDENKLRITCSTPERVGGCAPGEQPEPPEIADPLE